MNLFILQWNAKSLIAHGEEFKHYIEHCTNKPHIMCVQETWLSDTCKFKIHGYEHIKKTRNDNTHRGGVSIFIRLDVEFTKLDAVENLETLSIKVGDIIITNIYLTIDNQVKLTEPLFQNSNIICGDFNSKHDLWGSASTDSRGVQITKYLHKYNFSCLNDGTHTFFGTNGYSSPLDLTLVSSNLALECNWNSTLQCLNSDHCVVQITVKSDSEILNTTPPRENYNYNKADWKKFQSLCLEKLLPNLITDDVNVSHDNIILTLQNIIKQTIPKSKPFIKKSVPWWNKDCDEAVKNRKKAFNKLRRTGLPQHYIKFKELRGISQKIIKDTKRKYWQNFCSGFNDKNTKKVWRTIRGIKSSQNPQKIPNLLVSDECVISNIGKANALVEHFATASSNLSLAPQARANREQADVVINNVLNLPPKIEIQNSSLNKELTLPELKQALRNSKNTSPGEDGIKYIVYKQLPDSCLLVILQLFNLSWQEGILPSSWKSSIIIPIPKQDKNPKLVQSYRPISLTSTLCKLMERIIAVRLNWHLIKNKKYNIYQSAFRKNRTTQDHIIRLTSDLVKSVINWHAHTLGVFLDLEKAFDLVWHGGLLLKLKNYGVGGLMLGWIRDFLRDRTISVKVGNDISNSHKLQNGTPQGSVLSPLLFNIIMNDIPHSKHVQLSVYADDIAIWKVGNKLSITFQKVQTYLNFIIKWALDWGFKISETKSKAILFTRKNKPDIPQHITLDGTQLPLQNEIKFLGIIFDKKVQWRPQLQKLKINCQKAFNVIRSLSSTNWGADRKTLLLLYRALIRSRIDYGHSIYINCRPNIIKVINSIQYRALKFICHVLKGTPLAALQVDTGEAPLPIRWEGLLLKYSFKTLADPNHPTVRVLQDNQSCIGQVVSQFLQSENIQNIDKLITISSDPPWELPPINIDISLSNKINKKSSSSTICHSAALEFMEKWEGFRQIFTDGSKINDEVGFGIYIPHFNIKLLYKLPDNSSIFTAELIAIFYALQTIENKDINSYIIFSDSLGALIALQNHTTIKQPEIIHNILIKLASLYDLGFTIHLAWIPSHVGILGNDIVDQLAKNSLNNNNHLLGIKLAPQDYFQKIISHITKKWQLEWDENPTGLHYKNFHPEIKLKGYGNIYPKFQAKTLLRLKTGFNTLNYHLHKIKKHEDGLCDICQIKEDTKHFLQDCYLAQDYINNAKDLCTSLDTTFDLKNLITHPLLQYLLWDYVQFRDKCI